MPKPPVAVFVDPSTYHLEQDRLFDPETNTFAGDHILAPYAHLRSWLGQRGIPVHTGDRLESGEVTADLNIYLSLGVRARWPRLLPRDDVRLAAFFALECPIVEPKLYRHLPSAAQHFSAVYSFSTEAALRPFLSAPVSLTPFRLPQSFDRVHEDLWRCTDRGFLTMINANKRPRLQTHELYSERLRAVEFFARTGEIELYGVGWDVPPYRTGQTWVPTTATRALRAARKKWDSWRPSAESAAARRVWQGPTRSKSQTLSRYRFALCLENMVLPGWITEKLFDCLYTGTIPVYLGDPGIAEAVWPECFVDLRDFSGLEDLREHLRGMSSNRRDEMRAAGREFLASADFVEFSKERFARRVGDIVAAETGTSLL